MIEDKVICYRCVAAGIDPVNCFYSFKDMEESSATSDLVCPHCKIVEEEEGYERMNSREKEKVSEFVEKYENMRAKGKL